VPASVGLPLSDSSRDQNQRVIQQGSCDEPQTSQQAGEAPPLLLAVKAFE